jgi:hypothetical protein
VTIFGFFFSGVGDVWSFLLRGALYSAIWAVGCIILFFVIFRRLNIPGSMSSLLILSLPLFPVFIVFVPTILTETPGLFLALLGVYFGLRYVQQGRIVNSLLCGVSYVLASGVRESYLLFAMGNLLLFLVLSAKRRSLGGIVGYVIPLSLLLLFARREFLFTFDLLSRWFSPATSAASASSTGRVFVGAALGLASPFTITLHPDLARAITVGLGYGFNPLFAVFAAFSILVVGYDLYRRRSSVAFFLLLNAIWSFGAFIVPTEFFLEAMGGALSGWTSSIIRTTHSALPCIVGFPSLYRHLRIKRVAGLMLLLLIVGSTQVDTFAEAFQRSLSREPVDRLSLDYRAPYYRLYLLARGSGKTLVFGGIEMRGVRAYMAMLPNVVVVPVGVRGQRGALNETEFQALLGRHWDSIYLYDDWVTIKIPSWIDAYPEFYAQILRSRQYPGYTVEALWIDGESYALAMVKTSDVSVTLSP